MQVILQAGYNSDEVRRINRVRVSLQVLHVIHTHSIREHDFPGNFIPTAMRRSVVTYAMAKRESHNIRYGSLEECNARHMSKAVLELRGR